MKLTLYAVSLLVLPAGIAVASDASAGKAVYDKSCKSCHGADGTPNPSIAKMMKVEMKHLGSAEVHKRSEADLKKVKVLRQIDGKSMSYQVDVKATIDGANVKQFFLKPSDIVVVPEKFTWF